MRGERSSCEMPEGWNSRGSLKQGDDVDVWRKLADLWWPPAKYEQRRHASTLLCRRLRRTIGPPGAVLLQVRHREWPGHVLVLPPINQPSVREHEVCQQQCSGAALTEFNANRMHLTQIDADELNQR